MELFKNVFVALFWCVAIVLGAAYGIAKIIFVVSALLLYHFAALCFGLIFLLLSAGAINFFSSSE